MKYKIINIITKNITTLLLFIIVTILTMSELSVWYSSEDFWTGKNHIGTRILMIALLLIGITTIIIRTIFQLIEIKKNSIKQ